MGGNQGFRNDERSPPHCFYSSKNFSVRQMLKMQEKNLDEEDSSNRWRTENRTSCGGVRGIVDVRGGRVEGS